MGIPEAVGRPGSETDIAQTAFFLACNQYLYGQVSISSIIIAHIREAYFDPDYRCRWRPLARESLIVSTASHQIICEALYFTLRSRTLAYTMWIKSQ